LGGKNFKVGTIDKMREIWYNWVKKGGEEGNVYGKTENREV
jgi:hypothetical protein